jgi:broad specificity phosphatase PhoE
MIIDKRAIERNLGIYEGMPNEEEIFNEIRYYTKNVEVQKGEDTQTFTKRVFEFLEDIIKTYKGKKETILIVTHGFFLRSADWYFNGLPGENEEIKRFKNCQVDINEI